MRWTIFALSVSLLTPGRLPGDDGRQAVLEAQRQWIESYNRHNEKTLTEIESDDFSIVFGDGRVQNKADQLTNLRKPLPPGAEYQIVVESSDARLYGRAAVLTGIVAEKGKFPNEQGVMQSFSQRSRYTDTWILQKGHWRVVSSHLSEVK
jgi:hypothetical protein